MIDDKQLDIRLMSYVTKDALHDILASRRSIPEQFIEEHDRAFREIEMRLDAKVSRLDTMSDALSQVLRVQSDNYEAMRTSLINHETRISTLELNQATAKKDYVDFYDAIFGNSLHPDRESLMGMLKERKAEAKEQHKETMAGIADNKEQTQSFSERLEIIEEQIAQWKKYISVTFTYGVKLTTWVFASWKRAALVGVVLGVLGFRAIDPQLFEQIRILLQQWLAP